MSWLLFVQKLYILVKTDYNWTKKKKHSIISSFFGVLHSTCVRQTVLFKYDTSSSLQLFFNTCFLQFILIPYAKINRPINKQNVLINVFACDIYFFAAFCSTIEHMEVIGPKWIQRVLAVLCYFWDLEKVALAKDCISHVCTQ